jgi:hypothetical protein
LCPACVFGSLPEDTLKSQGGFGHDPLGFPEVRFVVASLAQGLNNNHNLFARICTFKRLISEQWLPILRRALASEKALHFAAGIKYQIGMPTSSWRI